MEGTGCVVVILLVVAAIVVFVIAQSLERDKAHRAYLESLDLLRSNPTSAALRTETLRLGRAYSNLTRNRKGVTIYDEIMLMNDINAACAAASAASASQPPQLSVEARLEHLASLRSKGLISDDEYADRRKKILDEV
jgi:hypothetical protein